MKPTIILYTHSDCSDVWPLFFGQVEKYMSDYNITTFVNKVHVDIPDYVTTIIYNDKDPYTKRLRDCLNQIDDEVLLFIHEDMILLDEIKHDLIEQYSEYVLRKDVNSVKLIYVGDSHIEASIDSTLVKNNYSKFSIQPTILTKEYFLTILDIKSELNIWDFERAIVNSGGDYMVKLGSEKKRGKYHYDSIVFPYIATAIVKGKWNHKEYKDEITSLFTEYQLSTNRGIF